MLFLTEAFVLITGCLAYRNLQWAAAWSPVYVVGLVVTGAAWDEVVIGLVVTALAGFAAAIGHGLRPTV